MLHDLILLLAGVVVGSMNAVAGGGMLVGFPILLAFGMPALIANATSNIIVLPGNIGATFGYRHYLRRIPKQFLILLLPAIFGAAIGAIILRHTSFSSFQRYVPWLILGAAVLFAYQPWLYKQLHYHLQAPKQLRQKIRPLLIVGLAVIPLSIYGGYFGAGFGFIMLAFLGFTKLHNNIHRMNALKSIITVCIASTSLACLYSAHLIDWHHGLVMGTGNIVGGYYGAVYTQKVSSHGLRIIVIIIGIATAIYLGLRSY